MSQSLLTTRAQQMPARQGGPDLLRDLPAWPVLALMWGMPLWWASGLLSFSLVVMAVPMLAFLVRRGRVALVPGVLPWVGYVAWMLPCAVMLDSLSRLLGFSVRFSQFAAAAIVLVYVVNAPRTLSVRRVLSGLTFVWVFVIVGGYLGMFFPSTTLTFTVGQLLPPSILDNQYASDLVFPSFSDVQTPYGADQPFVRPSAPFSYTNGWGAAIAILTPAAIASAIVRRTAKASIWLMIGLLAAVPPAIATTNRGLFVGLIAAVGYVLFRLMLRGKWLPFIWVSSLAAVLFTVLALSGLLDAIITRQDTVDTIGGRGSLYAETFNRTLLSPILGYGAPRPSFNHEITAGTQGMIWTAMFSFGFVGLALFALFLIGGILRTWSAPNLAALWMHSALVSAAVLSVFYGLENHLLSIFLVMGVLLRERYAARSTFWVANPRRVDHAH